MNSTKWKTARMSYELLRYGSVKLTIVLAKFVSVYFLSSL